MSLVRNKICENFIRLNLMTLLSDWLIYKVKNCPCLIDFDNFHSEKILVFKITMNGEIIFELREVWLLILIIN